MAESHGHGRGGAGSAGSMTEGSVSVVVSDSTITRDGIARVSFSHPAGNSLPRSLLTALARSVEQVSSDPRCRVIILESGGDGPFCAGASFDELLRVTTVAEGEQFFSGFAEVILALARAPQVTISRVHGKAAGGGVGLACATDLTLATANASVRLSELAIGIGPFTIGPVVERRVGASAFAELALTAEWRDSVWCLKHGLFSEVFESLDALEIRLREVANRMAGYPPSALAAVKRMTVSDVVSGGEPFVERLPAILKERVRTVAELVVSPEAQTLIRAAKR